MNDLLRIPCVLMRGGTSRGPFFLSTDLPSDGTVRDALLLSIMGSGNPLQIDGIGGGHPVTSKVAIVGPASIAEADVDYLFAQVHVADQHVDISPNCGNMLAAVGPFAIEAGLVATAGDETLVRIHNVNTRKIVEARVRTPGGHVSYLGDGRIDGVPGTASPIVLTFLDAAGAATGSLFPSASPQEFIDGTRITCIDCAMPLVLISACDLGATGHETPAELNADAKLRAKLEILRLAAGRRMGLGDVSQRVIPKPVIIAPPRHGGDIAVRYFVPHSCHPSLATTGAVGIATACLTEGTVAAEHLAAGKTPPATLTIEHPSGSMAVHLNRRNGTISAGIVRTARRLFEGHVLTRPYA